MSCGINMEEFRKALPRLEQMKSSQHAIHREQLEDEAFAQVQDSVRKSRRNFLRLIGLLLAGLFTAGVIAAVASALYANRVKQTQTELLAAYEASTTCLLKHDYICARDGFRALKSSGTEFPNLDENLNQAQFGLAQQYFDSGQWEAAVGELDELLQREPGNQEAIDLLKKSYDRWIDQLTLEGKLLQRWIIRRERDARFPSGVK